MENTRLLGGVDLWDFLFILLADPVIKGLVDILSSFCVWNKVAEIFAF
jgi:hypothetical protein